MLKSIRTMELLLWTATLCLVTFSLKNVSALSTATSPRTRSKINVNTTSLGKKSTALEVLKELNASGNLASYMTRDSKDPGVAVVTGGSSGIGIPTVETLALAGMKVVLCARDLDAGERARSTLPQWCQSNVRVQKLDLADLKSVLQAAEEITEKEGKLDVLLNNAGVMAPPKRMETKEGFELQFGTNHVGHHMLTRLLLPQMRSGGRIVTVASTAHSMGQIDFKNLNYSEDGSRKYTPWGAYGQSKLANILFAKGLDKKLKEANSDIISVSLHPGVIGTNLWRYSPSVLKPLLNTFLTDKNEEQGAATNVYSSIVSSDAVVGGEYLTDCAVAEPNNYGKDESGSLREKLWDATESLIKNAGFELQEDIFEA